MVINYHLQATIKPLAKKRWVLLFALMETKWEYIEDNRDSLCKSYKRRIKS